MIVHYCDRCGAHTTVPVYWYHEGRSKRSGAKKEIGKNVSDGLTTYELCPECMKEFYDFMGGLATQNVLPQCYKASNYYDETDWVDEEDDEVEGGDDETA